MNKILSAVAIVAFASSVQAETLWTSALGKPAASSNISSIVYTHTGTVTGITASTTSLVALNTDNGNLLSSPTNLNLTTTGSGNTVFTPNASLISGSNQIGSYPERGWMSTMSFEGKGYYAIDSLTLNMHDISLDMGSWHTGATKYTVGVSILNKQGQLLGTQTGTISFSVGHQAANNITLTFDKSALINMNEGIQLQIKAYDGGVGQYGSIASLTQGLALNSIGFNGKSVPEPATATLALLSMVGLVWRRRR